MCSVKLEKADKHCSMCKYYYCSPNHQMICFYGNVSKKITSRRKNGCKHFEAYNCDSSTNK